MCLNPESVEIMLMNFKYGRSSCCGSNCDGMLSELYQKENDTAERLFIFAKTKISVLRCGLRHIL